MAMYQSALNCLKSIPPKQKEPAVNVHIFTKKITLVFKNYSFPFCQSLTPPISTVKRLMENKNIFPKHFLP